MILRLLALAALLNPQDPPKPPAPGTPPAAQAPAEEIELKVETLKRVCADGVSLSGDFYGLPFPAEERPIFVCFHMENGSRGEFAKIAPRFADFACYTFAIDLRNGKETDGVPNETAASAAAVLKKTEFSNEDALVDVIEGLKWARELRPSGKIFLLGSGTSASLAILAAARNPGCADAVFAFSPAEDVPGCSIALEAKKISMPIYITCDGTPQESGRTRLIGNSIDKKLRQMVIPTGAQGAKRGALVLVQEDPALRDRFWMTPVKMILQLAPLAPPPPAEGTPEKG